MGKVSRFPFVVAAVGLLVALGLSLAAGPSIAPAKQSVAQKAKKKPKKKPKVTALKGLYNTRYCEILGVNEQGLDGLYEIEIFNTVGLNRCPEDDWAALDFTSIASQAGWQTAFPNGPRYWVMDQIVGARPPAPVNFGEIPMRRVATLRLPALLQNNFEPFKIERRTQWIFNKGRTVRELIAPDGRRYVMQAYTRNIDPALTESTLNQIGSNPLTGIPEGWRFRTRKLKNQLVMTANGTATIVRDGLRSVYQLAR